MVRGAPPPIPSAPRKTLLQWIEHDDGDTTGSTTPRCSFQAQALHQRIVPDPEERGIAAEALDPPAGLRLAPLG